MIKVENDVFHIKTSNSSYVMFVNDFGQLENFHYGKKIDNLDEKIVKNGALLDERFNPAHFNTWLRKENDNISYDIRRLEISTHGFGDYSQDTLAYSIDKETDTSVFLEYKGFRLNEDDGALHGMPHARNADDILVINLYDKYRDVHVDVIYKVFYATDTLTRSMKIRNGKTNNILLSTLGSFSMQLPDGCDNIMYKHGGWAQESHVEMSELGHHKIRLESTNGVSNEKNSPFIALSKDKFSDFEGDIFSSNLIYSTNWEIVAEKNQYNKVRVTGGINSQTFAWRLNIGEEFEGPEATMTFSQGGINAMRRNHNTFVKNHIVRKEWATKERPANANSWEAMYFDVSHDKIIELSDSASALGFKLLILDDGWFGSRDDDTTSLGDWQLNTNKFPQGLDGLEEEISKRDMDFGIWIEPEMISKESELFVQHPEWILETKNGPSVEGRYQHILDYTNPEVVDFAYKWISDLLNKANIKYVKWDMNRKISSTPNMGDHHKYVLGLYSLKEKLVADFPEILFEGCSAGGQRFDMGILFYFPQIWTSDNTDARSRMSIQYGTSLVFPLSTIKAHISDIPNHQTDRSIDLNTRINVSSFGIQGVESNVVKISDSDSRQIKEHMNHYQEIQNLALNSDFITVGVPEKDNYVFFSLETDNGYRTMLFKHGDIGDDQKTIQIPFLENGKYEVNGNMYSHDLGLSINSSELKGKNKSIILNIVRK